MKVKRLKIREVLATNSHKTIEVELQTEKGSVKASVPIGTSRGKYEVSYLPVDRALLKFDIIKRHFTRTIKIHNNSLYLSAGSDCNVCYEQDERRAAITRCDLDGKNCETLLKDLGMLSDLFSILLLERCMLVSDNIIYRNQCTGTFL